MLSKISEKPRFEPVAFSAVTILAMLSAGTATQDHDNNRSGQRTLSERVQTVVERLGSYGVILPQARSTEGMIAQWRN